MAHKHTREFYLIIADEQRKEFNIVGPMSDDSLWNKKITELQESGRKMRCLSTGTDRSVEEIAASYSRQIGFAYTTTTLIETPHRNDAEYRGPLPKYAANANRARVVQLLCKGSSPHSAWAEMNADYPGQERLQHSGVGDYAATCLRCGRVARDPYNWYR